MQRNAAPVLFAQCTCLSTVSLDGLTRPIMLQTLEAACCLAMIVFSLQQPCASFSYLHESAPSARAPTTLQHLCHALGMCTQHLHLRGAEWAIVLQALEAAGCFGMVLECVPPLIAAAATRELNIPTIGIGAGPHCSGQERGSFPTSSSASGPTCAVHDQAILLWGAADSMTCL